MKCPLCFTYELEVDGQFSKCVYCDVSFLTSDLEAGRINLEEAEKMKISDAVPKGQQLEGEPIKSAKVMNRNLVIKDVVFLPSNIAEGDYAIIQFEMNETLYTMSSGGVVVVRKLKQVADKKAFPVECKLVEIKGKSGRLFQDLVDWD